MAIKRIWHGWTTQENAEAYRHILEREVRPGIEANGIPGYRSLELLSRDLGEEVEFMTITRLGNKPNCSGEGQQEFTGQLEDIRLKVALQTVAPGPVEICRSRRRMLK